MDRTQHWDTVYRTKQPADVSWYQPHLARSLSLILAGPRGSEASVIDVGGGASTLADDLLQRGVRDLTVLDISARALAHANARLGARAEQVTWIVGDVTTVALPAQAYDVWHDRAVFHFLVDEEDRRRYVRQLYHALRPDGQIVMATFALKGPPRCSGLDVLRYSPQTLQAALGERAVLLESVTETHDTPSHAKQEFVYCRFGLKIASS